MAGIEMGVMGDADVAAERAALRRTVAPNAAKRVGLKFHPEKYVSWDHRKLGGRY